jgi:hypothetical protein
MSANLVLTLIGWVIGMMIALAFTFVLPLVFEVQPGEELIGQCERENILTEQQECVLSAKVVEK